MTSYIQRYGHPHLFLDYGSINDSSQTNSFFFQVMKRIIFVTDSSSNCK